MITRSMLHVGTAAQWVAAAREREAGAIVAASERLFVTACARRQAAEVAWIAAVERLILWSRS